MTDVKHTADAVALEQAIAAAEQMLLTAVGADDRGWQRLGAEEWQERITASFASIRKLIPEILDPELDHKKWMTNRYYRSGFELHAQGKSRNDSPYIAGHWTDQWQRGWDYADRLPKTVENK